MNVSNAFASAILFGVNKGLNHLMNEAGGKAVCRYIGIEMYNFLKVRGLIKDEMTKEDLKEFNPELLQEIA